MTKGRRVAASLLLLAAFGLAILGQVYFFRRREYLWDGLVLHVLAVMCFLVAWRLSRPGKPHLPSHRLARLGTWLRAWPVPAALLALGAFLSLLASLLSQDRSFDQPTGDVVLLWGLGVAAVGLAAVWPASWLPPREGYSRPPKGYPGPPEEYSVSPEEHSGPSGQNWAERWLRLWHQPWRGPGSRRPGRETWLEVASVAALTLLALVLRVAALDRVPYTLGGDEAWHGLLARQVLSGELRNPFTMGYMSMPTLFYWPLSWSLWLAGDGLVGLRLPAALAGTATVPILYLFARGLWGRRTAFLAAGFLATYDYHIHFSRLGANNVWDPLFVLLTMWALDRGLVRRQGDRERTDEAAEGIYRSFLAAGMTMGLSFFFYTGARLLPFLVGAYVAFVWLQRRRGLRRLGLHLALLLVAFLIVAGPMLSYAIAHPNEWNARINQVGILQSGWLAQEPELTGKGTAQILAEQFLRSAGAFHVYPDRTVWYGTDRPLLGFLAGVFGVLGMAWALAHGRERGYFLVLLWFWAVIISGGMLTESPPSSQRLVIAIPAVALLVAFGLEQSIRLGCKLLAFTRNSENLALGLLITILAVSSIHYYFVEFTPMRRYGSENGETATMMGYALRDLDRGTQVYLFGAPRIYWSFGAMTFLAPGVSGRDVVEPLASPPSFVDDSQGAVFLFLPERLDELSWVQQAFPGGQERDFYDAVGRLRFKAYEVP